MQLTARILHFQNFNGCQGALAQAVIPALSVRSGGSPNMDKVGEKEAGLRSDKT
jgi:hypothetical protein